MQIVNISLNLDKIDKTKIIKGKKGKYLPLTFFIQDEEDQFGNNVSCIQAQTEEERKAKAERNYLGNGKVVFSDGNQPQEPVAAGVEEEEDDNSDLPF